MPFGCFEQTSSTTYPNILVLDYLKSTGKETPAVRMKAEQYINLGYQRLLTFEVSGGGFSWFGDAPANKILTAYGVMEFADMAKVYEIDPDLVTRTQDWLAKQQNDDGSWSPDKSYLHAESWGKIQNSNLLVTAYIARALFESGYEGSALGDGLRYLEAHLDEAKDAYSLSFILNCCAHPDLRGTALKKVVSRLDDLKKEQGDQVWWEPGIATATHSHGPSANIETTALIATGLMKTETHLRLVTKALNYLIAQKDPRGTWHGTQATVLALRALLMSVGRATEKVNAEVSVTVNDREQHLVLTPDNCDVLRLVDFKDQTRKGTNAIRLTIEGQGNPMYQIVARHYRPWKPVGGTPSEALSIDVAYDRTRLSKDDVVGCTASVRNNLPRRAKMILVDLGVPPGFTVLPEKLIDAVEHERIQKFELTGRQIIVYLEELTPGQTVRLTYDLKAKYPMRAKTPRSVAYNYYNPEERGVAKPVEVTVTR